MHATTVKDPTTVVGALWRHMKRRAGHFFGGWELARVVNTTCLSTHIAAMRQQVPDGWEVPPAKRDGANYYYTVRRVKKQRNGK
jgi:hypothetical protein